MWCVDSDLAGPLAQSLQCWPEIGICCQTGKMRKYGCPGGRGPTANKKCKLSVAEQSAKLHARALAFESQGKMDELKVQQRRDLLDTTLDYCKGLTVMGMSPGPRSQVQ